MSTLTAAYQKRVPLSDARTLHTLNEFAVNIMSIRNTSDLFWYVAQNVVGRLGFPDCVIYEADPTQQNLTQVAAWGEKNPFGRTILNPMVIPFGKGITGRVAVQCEPVVINDLDYEADYISDTAPARSEICVPVHIQGRIVAVIDSEHPDDNAFGASELEIMSTVAAMISARIALLEEVERSNGRYNDLVQSHVQLSQEIDTRKAVEAELHEARRMETIGQLAGGVAHAFNNLLTVIGGNLELLELEQTGPNASLTDARIASDRASALVQNLLSFAQCRQLKPKRLQLFPLIETVLGQIEKSSTRKSFDWEHIDACWPVWVDRNGLELVLLNLLTNAHDAAHSPDGVQIAFQNISLNEMEAVTIAPYLKAGDYVGITIADDGPGIPEEIQNRIFDPFFSTKKTGLGSGMGLSMALGFARQSDGALCLGSQTTSGACLKMYLPRALPQQADTDTLSFVNR